MDALITRQLLLFGRAAGLSMAVLTALASGFHGLFAILREVASVIVGPAAAMAAFTALASGFYRTSTIMREIAGTALTAQPSGPRRLLPIFGKIAAVSRALLV